ncbi:MAG: acyl-CoA dehydrogenase family protein [Pseudomonadota bacterium]
MNFNLSQEQHSFFETVQAFAFEHIKPFAQKWEKDGTIPRTLWQHVANLGLGGLYVDEKYGGSQLSRFDGVLIFEAMAMSCPSVSAFLSIHNMAIAMIDRFGDENTRQKWLPKACKMEKIFSYCLSEPGCGSDAAALQTKAEKINNNYRITGNKAFISGGGYSDCYLTMVRTGTKGPKGISAIIIEHGNEGLSYGAFENKMGWRAQPTAQLQFDQCPIPLENLIGEEGKGFNYAMAGLDGGRLNIAAASLGGAQAAHLATLKYMSERQAFGKKLNAFQALQFRLADHEVKLQSARAFLYQAAWKLDQKTQDATHFCAMAKLYVSDVCFEVANDCLQLHGGYGYLCDYGIEKIVRDLRVHQILEGTNEIMRVIIARHLLDKTYE